MTTSFIGVGLGAAKAHILQPFTNPSPAQGALKTIFYLTIPPLIAWQLHPLLCSGSCQPGKPYECLYGSTLHKHTIFDIKDYPFNTWYTWLTSCFTHQNLSHYSLSFAGFWMAIYLVPLFPQLDDKDIYRLIIWDALACNLGTIVRGIQSGRSISGCGSSGFTMSFYGLFASSLVVPGSGLVMDIARGVIHVVTGLLCLGFIAGEYQSSGEEEHAGRACHAAGILAGAVLGLRKRFLGW